MSGDAEASADEAAAADGDATADEGRYCYCLVRVDDDDPTLDAMGLEETPVHVVREGDVGAVVHPRAEPYDSEDPIEVQRWLLAHQRVVDAAGEAFGTPLPFRFDTIVDGDDAAVRTWLADEYGTIDDALADLAGHWEYHVGVLADPAPVEAHLLETDDDLRELHEAADADEGGSGFLRQRQYEQRLKEARQSWYGDLTERVFDAAAAVREAREQEPDAGGAAGEAGATGEDADDDRTRVARVAVLATPDGADRLGERLDDVAAEPGVEIRYTGPWPPYSFAPSFEEEP